MPWEVTIRNRESGVAPAPPSARACKAACAIAPGGVQHTTPDAANVIAFPLERIADEVDLRRERLQAFFLGACSPHAHGETAVMAWLEALPANRCRRRAALAMRARLATYPAQGVAAATAGTAPCGPPAGENLRRRQVLAFLGALSRSHCACDACTCC